MVLQFIILSGMSGAYPVAGYQDIEIIVLDTWEVPYVTGIQDITYNWDTDQMVLRSNADGKLFLSTVDGRLLCLRTDKGVLPEAGDKPLRVFWDQPEDPGYLVMNAEPEVQERPARNRRGNPNP